MRALKASAMSIAGLIALCDSLEPSTGTRIFLNMFSLSFEFEGQLQLAVLNAPGQCILECQFTIMQTKPFDANQIRLPYSGGTTVVATMRRWEQPTLTWIKMAARCGPNMDTALQ